MKDARDIATRDVSDVNASPKFVSHDVKQFGLRFSWSDIKNEVVVVNQILHLSHLLELCWRHDFLAGLRRLVTSSRIDSHDVQSLLAVVNFLQGKINVLTELRVSSFSQLRLEMDVAVAFLFDLGSIYGELQGVQR